MFQCLPSDFEQHALLRVHLGGFAAGDVEELGVEGVEVVHVAAEAGGVRQRRRDLGGAVVERRPALGRHLGDRILALADELPVLVRAGDAAGEPAAQTDHRDRLVEVTAVAVDLDLGGQRLGAGQKPGQIGNRRVLPELDRRHFAAEQFGQLTGEHHRVARTQAQIAHRGVEVDVVGTATDVGHKVVGQPVP